MNVNAPAAGPLDAAASLRSAGYARVALVGAILCATLLMATVAHAARIVALGGDVTATIHMLGADGELVGVDSTSEWPASVQRLPDVGYLRQLNAEGVLSLHPDLVVANHDAGPPSAVAQLRATGVRIEILPEARTPDGVATKIRTIGHLVHRSVAAEKLAAKVEGEYATLAARVAGMRTHPRVVFLLSVGGGSLMAAGRGTAADAMITLAGGRNAARGYSGYKPVSAEALVALAPQVIVVMRQDDDAQTITTAMQTPGVAQTPAGTARRVIPVDGEALLGFGPRSAEQALALQKAFVADAP